MANEKKIEQQGLSEHDIRLKKMETLRKSGIEPWPYREPVDTTCQQVIFDFQEDSEKQYKVAGRLLTIRLHGKTGFATIQDRSGKLQVYIRKDIVGQEKFDLFTSYIDLGDIVWFSGISFKTKMGEITIKVNDFKLLSKCLHPLPEKFHGLADVEIKYRQRYLDLISDPDSKEKFRKRSKIVSLLRSYLELHDYMEVETPMLHPIPGGAAARPFVTHHNALDSEFYLRIAP
ncbi:lysine--tRNA ligase, partial [bacterium]|nr:lysine--tRNA ligase [bacterium]